MRNVLSEVVCFSRSKFSKALVNACVLVALVLGLSVTPYIADNASAASCYSLAVYTMRTGPESKPTVLVYWNKSGHPDAYKIKLYYQSKLLQTPSNWTVDTRYPQYNSGGWIGYFIATRWILSGNLLWDEDFRWKAAYCP